MVVAVNTPIVSYVGTGGTNTYPFTFPVFNSTQILVTVVGPGVPLTGLDEGIDYLVSGLNPSGSPASAGQITLINAGQAWLTGANLAVDMTLIIQSNIPYSQPTSIRNQGDFYRSALENALDNIALQIQQMNMLITEGQFLMTDVATGAVYRVFMANGVLSQQQIS